MDESLGKEHTRLIRNKTLKLESSHSPTCSTCDVLVFKCREINNKPVMWVCFELYLYQGPVPLGQAGGQLTTAVKNSTRISEIQNQTRKM